MNETETIRLLWLYRTISELSLLYSSPLSWLPPNPNRHDTCIFSTDLPLCASGIFSMVSLGPSPCGWIPFSSLAPPLVESEVQPYSLLLSYWLVSFYWQRINGDQCLQSVISELLRLSITTRYGGRGVNQPMNNSQVILTQYTQISHLLPSIAFILQQLFSFHFV